MYAWPRGGDADEYLGAAHGVMGIWYLLLHADLTEEFSALIENGIRWLLTQKLANGN